MIPANAGGAGAAVSFSVGKSFLLGVGVCVTGGIADNDTTAVAGSAYLLDLDVK